MTVAFIVLGAVFALCEVLHFKRERELIRRLSSKNEAEYVKNYEKEDKVPSIPSPAREAMKRWKAGTKG